MTGEANKNKTEGKRERERGENLEKGRAHTQRRFDEVKEGLGWGGGGEPSV